MIFLLFNSLFKCQITLRSTKISEFGVLFTWNHLIDRLALSVRSNVKLNSLCLVTYHYYSIANILRLKTKRDVSVDLQIRLKVISAQLLK